MSGRSVVPFVRQAILFYMILSFERSSFGETLPLKVLSYNILCKECVYEGEVQAVQWFKRNSALIDEIREQNFDIIALQEVQGTQFVDISNAFEEEYVLFYPTPDSSTQLNNLVLYKRSRFVVLTTQIVELPSSDHQKRRLLVLHLKDLQGKQQRFYFVNAHLDHRDVTTRLESIKLIAKLFPDSFPVMVVGDFNATPSSQEIKEMKSLGYNDLNCDSAKDACMKPTHASGVKIDYLFGRDVLTLKNTTVVVGDSIVEIDDAFFLPLKDGLITLRNKKATLPSDHFGIGIQIQWLSPHD